MSESGASDLGQEEAASDISVKISPVRRLCRLDSGEKTSAGHEAQVESVVACPSVLRQLSGQLRAPIRGVRGGGRALPSLATIRSRLVSRPYWRRCLCSPTEVPTISERELAPLLALTPAHRFIVLVVTNTNADRLSLLLSRVCSVNMSFHVMSESSAIRVTSYPFCPFKANLSLSHHPITKKQLYSVYKVSIVPKREFYRTFT
ncbi:uncharacterized protein LOC122248134 [Penaeus japonicus]|uniref:uncharacterized protein LOC122248134 n=1 Tax=Penaeus japonicus TaxID=27405 RepID=UPI001C70D267|nr:uncharacterized protein LOC122248134 [Penaeus japonicus]